MRKDIMNAKGFTLIEVLVASFILIVGILGTTSLLIKTIKYNESTQKRIAAQQILQGVTSELKSINLSKFTESNLKNNFGFSSNVSSGYPSGGDVNSFCPSDYEYRLYKTYKTRKTVNGINLYYKYTIKLCVDDDYLKPYLKRAIITIYWNYGGKKHNMESKIFITPGV